MTPAPVVDPATGWLSFIVQCGSFGLITYVVVILFPRMNREQSEERIARDRVFATVVESLQIAFEERNKVLIQGIETQTVKLALVLEKNSERVEKAVSDVIHRKS